MRHESLNYEADGLAMRGEFFAPEAEGARAAVLVFPEAFGLSEHAISRAKSLCDLGFAALACDLHGEGRLIDDLPAALGLIGPLMKAPDRIRDRSAAALKALTARPEVDATRVAAIGFCFGGTMALELARSGASVKAVVGFHSGLGTAAPKMDAQSIKGRVLVCIGGDDPMIDAAQRAAFEGEMRDAGVDWQMHLYGRTVHSFTNQGAAKRNMPDAIRYSPEADARSWASMRELFAETLG